MTTAEKIKCADCGAPMILRNSNYGKFYGCSRFPECRGTHGAHQETGEPLGIPANTETKQLRIAVHDAFDPLWLNGQMGRNEAYEWLADQLGIPKHECHIGSFDKEMCERALEILTGER